MNTSNQSITFKGESISVTGRELKVGDSLPAFKLTGNDLSDVSSEDFSGKSFILCTVPSLDTPVCSVEAKQFSEKIKSTDIQCLFVSMDLPFAQARWCGAEGVDNIATASDYKYRALGEDFGVVWQGPQLLARAVFAVDASGTITHVEYVADITQEPNYDAALNAL